MHGVQRRMKNGTRRLDNQSRKNKLLDKEDNQWLLTQSTNAPSACAMAMGLIMLAPLAFACLIKD